MAIRPIVMHPDERLRRKCKRVGQPDRRVQQLIDDLVDTMREARGVGLG